MRLRENDFESKMALCQVFGGDLRRRCMEKGMSEQLFDKLPREYQCISSFIDKHDSKGNTIRKQ